MFETNKLLRQTVSTVAAFCEPLKRGDTLHFTDIERLSGLKRYEPGWGALIRKVRRSVLRDRGIALRPIVNVGYRLCEPNEQLEYCSRNRQRRAVRQLNRGVTEIDALPTGVLSLHQQTLRASMLTQMISERRHVKRGLRDQRDAMKKTETMPMMAASM